MIKAELLTEISVAQVGRFVSDPNFGLQEKHNGERRLLLVQNGAVQNLNREGDPGKRISNKQLIAALIEHPLQQFVIDVEIMTNGVIWVFDILVAGDEMLHGEVYEYREARYHAEFKGYSPLIKCVDTVRGEEAKRAALLHLAKEQAEGVCFKDMRAIYKQGRSGNHFKLKFWKELDAVVLGPSPKGHDSVEIGVYDNSGALRRICGCSLIGKFKVAPGDVIAVKYLYATDTDHVVQPTMLRKRTDKAAKDCTVDQLVINKNWR